MKIRSKITNENTYKILTPILSSMLVACGGGGGGGAPSHSSAPVNPSENVNSPQVSPSLAGEVSSTPTVTALSSFNSLAEVTHTVTETIANHVHLTTNTLTALQDQHKERFAHSQAHFLGVYQETIPTLVQSDEGKIQDIGIVDTFFYESKGLRDKTTLKTRMLSINQEGKAETDKRDHGTMVAQVIAITNDQSKMHGESIAIEGKRYSSNDHSVQARQVSVNIDHYQRLIKKGVKIFNNSYGTASHKGASKASYVNELGKLANEDKIFIWAAGNQSLELASLESRHPTHDQNARNGWITVAATTQDFNKKTTYSNKIGEEAQNWGITALGDYQIPLPQEECPPEDSKKPRGCYHTILGTSFATPAVTATVANVWNKYPWMDNHLVVVTVLSTANKIGTRDLTEGPSPEFGWGLLNNDRALLGPARLDKRLLTNRDTNDLLTVKFDHRLYEKKEKLTWANDLVGDAGIRKQGSGTLYLKGDNRYTGDTVIENGALEFSRALSHSKVKIQPHGALIARNSNSQVTIGNEKDNVGTYVLNNDGGKLGVYGQGLKLTGNYKGTNKAKIAIDIDTAQLEVTGTLDMGNGYIVADIENTELPSRTKTTQKTIIKANKIENYDGDYAVSKNVSKYINISHLGKKENNIEVEYKRNDTKYIFKEINYPITASIFSAGENIDKALDELAENTAKTDAQPSYATLMSVDMRAAVAKIMQADVNDLPQIVKSLSGEIYASSQNLMFKQSQVFNRTLSTRIASLLTSEKSGVWADGLYAKNHIRQTGYSHLQASTTGTQLGVDGKFDDMTLGAAVVVGNTHATLNENAGSIKSKHTSLSLYGAYDFGPFYLSGRVGMTKADSKVDRMVIDKPTTASYQSHIYHLYTELGTQLAMNKVSLNPFFASEMSIISRGQFGENVAFGIHSDKKRYDVNAFVVGVRGALDFEKIRLFANIAHAYTPNPQQFDFDAKFRDTTSNILIKGAMQAKHNTLFDAGLAYKITNNFTLESKYSLSIQEGKKEGTILSIGGVYYF
ncbi:S8 family serine peptidase [Pasteurella sp. PK-2025]|uniref:S8 family serine peptidase n=1 Tax=Pasteurella sp. PK-2025 TaxID=3413133 RepID=UPI003C794C21